MERNHTLDISKAFPKRMRRSIIDIIPMGKHNFVVTQGVGKVKALYLQVFEYDTLVTPYWIGYSRKTGLFGPELYISNDAAVHEVLEKFKVLSEDGVFRLKIKDARILHFDTKYYDSVISKKAVCGAGGSRRKYLIDKGLSTRIIVDL